MSDPAAVPDSSLQPLTEHEFTLLRDLIYRQTGIHLAPTKKALLVGRLTRRLRELKIRSFGRYFLYVREGRDPLELTRLLEAICTHETHFFREPRQFEYIERQLLPEWERAAASGLRPRQIRAWSAGCSSGEEPYSLAMSLLGRFGDRGWRLEILATDLSTRVLDKAREGLWPVAKASEIPAPYLRRFMLKGTRSQEGHMKVGPLVRSIVRFEHCNLNSGLDGVAGTFDLILCRNVLIYFDARSRSEAVHRLIARLAPGGRLFLGHSETLNGVTTQLCSVGPTVYAWPVDGSGPRDQRFAGRRSAP